MVLTDFFVNYLQTNQMHLAGQVVKSLWGRAPCLQRWGLMADLLLLGEGAGAAHGREVLPAEQRLAMVHLMDAALRLAKEESSSGEGSSQVLDDAACALMPRLARLIDLCSEDHRAMEPVSAISKLLVEHVCSPAPPGTLALASPPRALLISVQQSLAQQGCCPRAAAHLADVLVLLARRSTEALNLVLGFLRETCGRCLAMMRSYPLAVKMYELGHCLTVLVALCNRGVDVGIGNKSLLPGVLAFLEKHLSTLSKSPAVAPRVGLPVVLQLLELAFLLLAWRLRAMLSAATAETPQCSLEDLGPHAAGRERRISPLEQLQGRPVSAQDREETPKAIMRLLDTTARLAAHGHSRTTERMQAMSAYLSTLHVAFGAGRHLSGMEGFLYHARITDVVGAPPAVLVPKEQVAYIEAGMKALYKGSAGVRATSRTAWSLGRGSSAQGLVDLNGQFLPSSEVPLAAEGIPLTAIRLLLEKRIRHADPGGVTDNRNVRDENFLAAITASCMVSQCECEAIYGGLPGRLLLAQAASGIQPPPVREAALNFARRLRRLAAGSRTEAERCFKLLLSATNHVINSEGTEAGSRLAAAFLEVVGPCPEAGQEAKRLSAGFLEAARAHLEAASARLEALLPWLRASCCPLRSVAAQALYREVAAKQKADHENSPSMRMILLALQALASAMPSKKRKRLTWRDRLAVDARKRLKRRRVELETGPCLPLATTGWLQKPREARTSATPQVSAAVQTPLWVTASAACSPSVFAEPTSALGARGGGGRLQRSGYPSVSSSAAGGECAQTLSAEPEQPPPPKVKASAEVTARAKATSKDKAAAAKVKAKAKYKSKGKVEIKDQKAKPSSTDDNRSEASDPGPVRRAEQPAEAPRPQTVREPPPPAVAPGAASVSHPTLLNGRVIGPPARLWRLRNPSEQMMTN